MRAVSIITKSAMGGDEVKTKVTTTRTPNPFRGRFTSLESRTLGKHLKSPTAWAIVQGKNTTLPSLIRTKLSGEETVDIRVKRDQGARVGGGDLPVEATLSKLGLILQDGKVALDPSANETGRRLRDAWLHQTPLPEASGLVAG